MPATEITEANLRWVAEQLLALQPAIERYRELENLAIGAMLTLGLKEFEVEGRARISVEGPGLTVAPVEKSAGTLFEEIVKLWPAD